MTLEEMFSVSVPFPGNTRALISTKVETAEEPYDFGNPQVIEEQPTQWLGR